MKIKITNSTNKSNWYHSAIGMEFEVDTKYNNFYGVKNGSFISRVDIEDCVEIKEIKFTGRKLGRLRNGDFIEIDFNNDY